MLDKEAGRLKRHGRIRKKMFGTAERPRLNVHRSLKNLYVQVIDDTQSRTLYSFSTQDKEFIKKVAKASKTQKAKSLGQFFAGGLKEKGIRVPTFKGGFREAQHLSETTLSGHRASSG